MTAHLECVDPFVIESAAGNNIYTNGVESIKIRTGIKVLDNNQVAGGYCLGVFVGAD